MAVTEVEIRSGAYYDSVVLMQLQRSLADLAAVLDAGVVMGTDANKDLLAQSDLLAPEAQAAGADDLIIVVRAEDEASAQAALDRVDDLLASRRKGGVTLDRLAADIVAVLHSASDSALEAAGARRRLGPSARLQGVSARAGLRSRRRPLRPRASSPGPPTGLDPWCLRRFRLH